jgi:hypothetical protein
MEAKVVTCGYVFTQREFGRAMRAFYCGTRKGLFVLWIVPLAVLAVAGGNAIDDFVTTPYSPHQSPMLKAVLDAVPAIVMIPIFVGLMLFLMKRVFVKSMFFNSPMNYTVSEESCRLQAQLIDMTVQWAALRKWKSGKNGFLLFLPGGRSFHWLPYDRFESADDIAWTRDLLTRKSRK